MRTGENLVDLADSVVTYVVQPDTILADVPAKVVKSLR
jgi:acetyltransferase-like isoleucine patch superfamily enzyme